MRCNFFFVRDLALGGRRRRGSGAWSQADRFASATQSADSGKQDMQQEVQLGPAARAISLSLKERDMDKFAGIFGSWTMQS